MLVEIVHRWPTLVSVDGLLKETIRENRHLITDEPVEVQDCKKIIDHFKRNLQNIPQFSERKSKDANMSPVGLANTRISPMSD